MLKRFLFTLTLVLLISLPSSGQALDITVFGGYQFGGSFGADRGRYTLKSAENFGVSVDAGLRPGAQLTLSYWRQPSTLHFRPNDAFIPEADLFDMAISYYQIGGLYGLRRGRIMPYGTVTLGAVEFKPQNSNRSNEWKFAFTFGGGVKYYATDFLGVRLQGTFMAPILRGSAMWCQPGDCVIEGGAGILQGNVMAGIFLALGQ